MRVQPYTVEDFSGDRFTPTASRRFSDPTPRMVVVEMGRLWATVKALSDAYKAGDEVARIAEEWRTARDLAEKQRDEARECIADALSVLFDPATSGEHWSILPSVVENLRDERDALLRQHKEAK